MCSVPPMVLDVLATYLALLLSAIPPDVLLNVLFDDRLGMLRADLYGTLTECGLVKCQRR